MSFLVTISVENSLTEAIMLIDDNLWKEVKTRDEDSTARNVHTCVVWQNHLIVWGGCDDSKCLSHIYSICLGLSCT